MMKRLFPLTCLLALAAFLGCNPNEKKAGNDEAARDAGMKPAAKGEAPIIKSPPQEDFDRLVREKPVVLVDFNAVWCGPCRMMDPVVKDLARQYQGRVTVIEVDVDARPELAVRYNIESIPRFLVFRQGKQTESIEGVTGREVFVDILDRELARASK